jgi:hypothetical protein
LVKKLVTAEAAARRLGAAGPAPALALPCQRGWQPEPQAQARLLRLSGSLPHLKCQPEGLKPPLPCPPGLVTQQYGPRQWAVTGLSA